MLGIVAVPDTVGTADPRGIAAGNKRNEFLELSVEEG
jgi:hypothetical protein